ncbi:predicted protein [Histoplasma mississippiense (nom. inval.)]|uniref:predicted protein n=1 Tax=Ajellomyces capsulatus (strain NAm1 / WU24) TaxID=2059318 RepID=UPI000157D3B9|nr:predicted protein [Histoplasma mississippiense (nom. inval.)]EDN04542.1 predicted protein [Histoplasma mississippiense (nom. inval.)]
MASIWKRLTLSPEGRFGEDASRTQPSSLRSRRAKNDLHRRRSLAGLFTTSSPAKEPIHYPLYNPLDPRHDLDALAYEGNDKGFWASYGRSIRARFQGSTKPGPVSPNTQNQKPRRSIRSSFASFTGSSRLLKRLSRSEIPSSPRLNSIREPLDASQIEPEDKASYLLLDRSDGSQTSFLPEVLDVPRQYYLPSLPSMSSGLMSPLELEACTAGSHHAQPVLKFQNLAPSQILNLGRKCTAHAPRIVMLRLQRVMRFSAPGYLHYLAFVTRATILIFLEAPCVGPNPLQQGTQVTYTLHQFYGGHMDMLKLPLDRRHCNVGGPYEVPNDLLNLGIKSTDTPIQLSNSLRKQFCESDLTTGFHKGDFWPGSIDSRIGNDHLKQLHKENRPNPRALDGHDLEGHGSVQFGGEYQIISATHPGENQAPGYSGNTRVRSDSQDATNGKIIPNFETSYGLCIDTSTNCGPTSRGKSGSQIRPDQCSKSSCGRKNGSSSCSGSGSGDSGQSDPLTNSTAGTSVVDFAKDHNSTTKTKAQELLEPFGIEKSSEQTSERMAQQIALQGQVDPTKLRFLYEHNDDGVYIFVCVSVPVFTHGGPVKQTFVNLKL